LREARGCPCGKAEGEKRAARSKPHEALTLEPVPDECKVASRPRCQFADPWRLERRCCDLFQRAVGQRDALR
jgi:hypothetical protein